MHDKLLSAQPNKLTDDTTMDLDTFENWSGSPMRLIAIDAIHTSDLITHEISGHITPSEHMELLAMLRSLNLTINEVCK